VSDESETAARYHARAEELHAIAASTQDAQSRLALERLAAEYESLAATLEVIDRSKQAIDSAGRGLKY
jgi:hypothetical protein